MNAKKPGKAIILMFDSLNRHMLSPYADTFVNAPNFARLAARSATFDHFYAGSMPCMPARRELHTGRYNFLHRSWGPLEPFDDSMPQMLKDAGIHTHLVSDHPHYWEDGGATYHTRYSTWEVFRGQEGDPWKGVVGAPLPQGNPFTANMKKQDAINRRFMPTEAEHSQTLTVDAGIEFIETNAQENQWMLQLELFDPHEPFFTYEQYKALYPDDYEGRELDWPNYSKVTESAAAVDHVRNEYAALVSMCDKSLGRVLDTMDELNLWDDTLLIVNTDHGFLLGEHGWWAKTVQPWFNELVHLPMFLWDPRVGHQDTRRGELAQTIDIAPTLLKYFGLEPTKDMQGTDLASHSESGGHDAVLFGVHGGHVNITDGRYVYMRAAVDISNGPLEEYTLMPTHMRSRFSVAELANWEPSEPFSFTKDIRTMRISALPSWMNPWIYGSLLFDLDVDPEQNSPIVDDKVELRMLQLLADHMHLSDAPRSQFERLGIPFEGKASVKNLLVRAQAERAAEIAVPLPEASALKGIEFLTMPIDALLNVPGARPIVEHHAPNVSHTELIAVQLGLNLITMASMAWLSARQLMVLGEDLSAKLSA